MTGFQEKKNGEGWFSDPVYSYFGGYKIIFRISAWLGSVMIDYSCSHTSRESNGPMSGVKNSDVSAQSRALFSE